MAITADQIKRFAHDCGFELAGVASAQPLEEFSRFDQWRLQGFAGQMSYLTDHRGDLRSDPRNLLPSAQSIVCVGKLYNNVASGPAEVAESTGKISRYATGDDYHPLMRSGLKTLADRIAQAHGQSLEFRACVDTAPLLERSLARLAGLGWIGKNTCLINQQQGSWFFLGELLLSIPVAPDTPPPDRCGTCRRCIDACPTDAIVPGEAASYQLDARRCISYLTIEHRGDFPEGAAEWTGHHLFGCDICQEVCPWNRRAPITDEPAFQARSLPAELTSLADLTADQFRSAFHKTPVWRARYSGFLRNVAAAMGNSGRSELKEPLTRLAQSEDAVVAKTARESLDRLKDSSLRKADPGR